MSGSEDSEEIIGKDEFIVWLQARLTTSEQARQTAEARADLNFNRAERAGIRAKKHQAAKEQAEARVETLSAALDKTTAEWADMKAAKEQAEAKLVETEKDIASREARRIEILEWLEDKIGTAFDCPNCHWSGYHQNAYECEECGTPFPLEHHIAFKLHASHKGDWQSE